MTHKVFRGDIFSLNAEQFVFEHYLTGQKLRSVDPLAFLQEKKQKRTLSGLEKKIPEAFQTIS